MGDIGREVKIVEFEPFPEGAPAEPEPVREPAVVPAPAREPVPAR